MNDTIIIIIILRRIKLKSSFSLILILSNCTKVDEYKENNDFKHYRVKMFTTNYLGSRNTQK